jgi:hypothetical protein
MANYNLGTQAILQAGSSNVMPGNLPLNVKFQVEINTAPLNGKVTRDNVGEAEVTLKGAQFNESMSIFRVAGFMVTPDDVNYDKENHIVSLKGESTSSARELSAIGFKSFAKYIKAQEPDGQGNPPDASNFELEVVGKVYAHNRYSDMDGAHSRLYPNDFYKGYADYDKALSQLKPDADDRFQVIRDARATLLSSGLKENISNNIADYAKNAIMTPVMKVSKKA